MRYSKVHIEAIGYELAPVVISSSELEGRLTPMYEALRIAPGQLEALTGISERRWWEPDYRLSDGAAAAARKALEACGVPAAALETVIYAGVCRENFEPATACAVAAQLGVDAGAAVYDISNACLGVLNGMLEVANRIELGQIRAGIVVSCESAREINEVMIDRMLRDCSMELFTTALATLTGGSGAAAVVLSDGSFGESGRRALRTGVTQTEPQHHALCRWGHVPVTEGDGPAGALTPSLQYMHTDSVGVLNHGVALGERTWAAHLAATGWAVDDVDRVICHQVGSAHQEMILKLLGVPKEKDFTTFRHLGNIGTVSLPLTAALAEERGVLEPGQRVSFLGIGSGLNCMMLGIEW
ncbi:MAG: 3-oxoacyl-ACP synthase III [Planctomycetota bacterium]|jgi:3-oxoacyl-[acyl-carrier-protein] synthase-3